MGNGKKERFATKDFNVYYQALKRAFLEFQAEFSPEQPLDPADSSYWGDWSNYAEQLLLELDHLFQVANITKGQIKKLNQNRFQSKRSREVNIDLNDIFCRYLLQPIKVRIPITKGN